MLVTRPGLIAGGRLALALLIAGAALLGHAGVGHAEAWPDGHRLFPAPLADPTQPAYGVRLRSAVRGRTPAEINLGDEFGIFSWRGGRIQLGVAAGVAARFALATKDLRELEVADYTLAFPLDAGFERVALRLTYQHVSSHLGDDYILATNVAILKRVTDEVRLDLSVPFAPAPGLLARAYAGGGYAVNMLPESSGRFRFQGGGEIRRAVPSLGGSLFAAADLQVLERSGWEPAFTARAGWSGPDGSVAPSLFLEYSSGPPPYLAFMDRTETGWAIGLALRR